MCEVDRNLDCMLHRLRYVEHPHVATKAVFTFAYMGEDFHLFCCEGERSLILSRPTTGMTALTGTRSKEYKIRPEKRIAFGDGNPRRRISL